MTNTTERRSFAAALDNLREYRWQHATNDTEVIPYIDAVEDAHEREMQAATAGAGTCEWRYEPTDDDDEYDHKWVTSCGWEWDAEGTDELDENGRLYCSRCGGRIEVAPDGR